MFGNFTFDAPFPGSPQPGPTQIRVGVYINGSNAMGGFTVILNATHTVLKAAGVDFTGSVLLGTPVILAECLGGILVTGSACSNADGADTLDLSATNALGSGNTIPPTTGLLFTAIFNVTGVAPPGGVPISFQQSARFCPTSSTVQAGEAPYCVSIAEPPSTTPIPETVQSSAGTLFNNNACATTCTIPWLAETTNATTSSALKGAASGNHFNITVTPENGWPGFSTDSIAFSTTVSTGFAAPLLSAATATPTNCFGTGTTTQCSILLTASTLAAGTYYITVFGSYVAFDTTGVTYSLVATLTVQVKIQSVLWTINGASSGSAQALYMAKGPTNIMQIPFTVQSLGSYSGTIVYTTGLFSGGTTGITFVYPATFTLGADMTVTKFVNVTATGYGTALYAAKLTPGGLAVQTSATLSIHVTGVTIATSPNSTITNLPGDIRSLTITLHSLPASSTGFTGPVTISSTAVNATQPTNLITVVCPTTLTLTAGGTASGTCSFSSLKVSPYTVTIKATAGTNGAIVNSTIVTVNVGNPASVPTITFNPILPTNPADEGVTLTASWTISSNGSAVTNSCINWGDGTSQCSLQGPQSATHSYSAGSSLSKVFTITVNATNGVGTGQNTEMVTINDLNPTIIVTAPSTAVEGTQVSVSFTANDDEAVTKTCVSFGDGSSVCGASPQPHTYSTGGLASKQFTITVNATDAAGLTSSSTALITITDAKPTVGITSVTPNPATVGQSVMVVFTATDDEALSKTCVNFGDGFSVCGSSPQSHAYSVGASFTVTVNATDLVGQTSSVSTTETVGSPPPTLGTPVVSPNPANEGVSVTATWTITSATTVTNSCINWGDGTSQCGLQATKSATHPYSAGNLASKIFTITVNATNSAGTGQNTATVTIKDLVPTVMITAPSTAAEGSVVSVSFSASDDEAISTTCVNFGDGHSVCGTSPQTHMYSTGGVASKQFTITVNATDLAGLTGSNTASITITDLTPSVTVTAPSTAVEGTIVSVSFTATDDEGFSKTCVNFGDGSSICGASPQTHVYSTGGLASKAFTITVNATDLASLTGSNTASISITDAKPTVTITSLTPNPAAINAVVSVGFTAADDEAISKTCVNFGDGFTVCGSSPQNHAYTTSGTFTVTVNATDGAGQTNSASMTETVGNVPVVSITSLTPNPANEGATVMVTFTVNSAPSSVSHLTVNWGDGTTDTLSNTATSDTHAYHLGATTTPSTMFTVTISATNSTGTGSKSAQESVNDLAPTVTLTVPGTAVEGTTVSVSFTATDDESISKTCVNFGDGSSICGTSPQTHVYSTGGAASMAFTITVNATDLATLTASNTASITVTDAKPTVTITSVTPNPANIGQTVSVAFTATDDEAVSKTCVNFGDGSSSCGSSPQTHAYSTFGTFTVTVNATDSAGMTASATTTETVSQPQPPPTVTINSVSPNPANEGSMVTATWTVTSTTTVTNSCISWGDGTSACGLQATTSAMHAYSTGGLLSKVFTVTVNATNGSGTGSNTAMVTIKDLAPTVTIVSVSPNPANTGTTVSVSFTATDDEAVTMTCVNFGDGSSACGTSPQTHAYAAAGIFTVAVNATDAAGQGNTVFATANVQQTTPTGCGTSCTASIASDATISNASGSSTSINFTATGSKGTTAYANITIPKSAVPNINALQVMLNGTIVTPTITSDSTNFFVFFTFTFHSTFVIHISFVSTAQPVTLTFSASNADDFENGVGQLEVFVNNHFVVDIPAGLNNLQGSGDFTALDGWNNFGPFTITQFVMAGQNNITFVDPLTSHIALVRNVTIIQGTTLLLHVSRAAPVFPGHIVKYTFSIPPLVITSFTASTLTPAISQTVTFTATYTGGTAPFKCIFTFGDGEFAIVNGVNGSCSTTHDYDFSGTFRARVTVVGASTSDVQTAKLRIIVPGAPSSGIPPASIEDREQD